MNIRLSTAALNPENNFNVVRLGAASGVFISHLFPVYGLELLPGVKLLGYVSVNVFFIISGFLVTKSLLDRNNIITFIWSRVLRVYPALMVVVLITTFVIGPLATTLTPREYLIGQSSSDVYRYLYDNTIGIYYGVNYNLPGVFNGSTVNANLWTLAYELQMYTVLGILGSLFILFKNTRASNVLFISIWFVISAISMTLYVVSYTNRSNPIDVGISYDYFRFASMFGTGVLAYMLRKHIVLCDKYFFILLSAIVMFSQNRAVFVALTYSALFYMVLYIAYFNVGRLGKINKMGDYSYGIYIYGYPILMLTKNLLPNSSIYAYIVISSAATLICAVLSWTIIEKRALRYKEIWQNEPDSNGSSGQARN